MKVIKAKRRFPTFKILSETRLAADERKRKAENERRFVEETLKTIREVDREIDSGKARAISFEEFCEWIGLN